MEYRFSKRQFRLDKATKLKDPMTQAPLSHASENTSDSQKHRIFLVVVDDSTEMEVALRFACQRARNTGGRVALLHVTDLEEFQHWAAIGALMQEEKREQAEELMQDLSGKVNKWAGMMPLLFFREGSDRGEELLSLIAECPDISILVLAANTGPKGPGPLINALTGKFMSKLKVPMTIVPGNLDFDQIADLT